MELIEELFTTVIAVETDELALQYMDKVGEVGLNLHVTAPRTSPNLNYFGEHRGGEIPAMEFGQLAELLSLPTDKIDGGYERVINYLPLETGWNDHAPMPLGAITLAMVGDKW